MTQPFKGVVQAPVGRFNGYAQPPRWLAEFWGIALLIVITMVAGAFSYSYIYSNHLNGPPIRSDGYGYYAYLPAVFIDHNLSLSSALNNLPEKTSSYEVGINPGKENGRYLDKYAVGAAALQSPFFLLAHAMAGIANEPQTGYTKFYQVANSLSAVVYLCVGMFFLYSALRILYPLEISLVAVALSVFGTNVFHYATYDASFSHIYQFALTAVLLYVLLRARELPGKLPLSWVVPLGTITGLILLTRITNAPVVLLPAAVLVSRWLQDGDLKTFLIDAFLAAACALGAFVPQLLYWKLAAGHWFVNAYLLVGEDARFFWMSPALTDFLFSIRKGALFWTPVLIVGLLGLPALVKRMGLLGWAVALVICLHIYICASWYCWWFGGSFGSRPMVDIMPLFTLSIAGAIDRFGHQRKLLLAFAMAMFVALNLTLMYAYWRGFIPFDNADVGTFLSLPMRLKQGH